MKTQLGRYILNSPSRIAMPIGVYAGLEITGASVREAITNPQKQFEAVMALRKRFNSQFLLTAMDLSVEAEAFGCQIRMSEDEIPTVIGRKLASRNDIDNLLVPPTNSGRTFVHLQTAKKLVSLEIGIPVLGVVIGPFSLAGRLFGVSEALELSLTDPELLLHLLKKVTRFLTEYVIAFRDQGVDGVIMAEPAAGLLSPRSLGKFSSNFIREILDTAQTDKFSIILHNCGAKYVHLPMILESGAKIYHFGAPMDMEKALNLVDEEIILAGNIDPTGVFFSGSVEEVESETKRLMKITSGYKNFIASSGCDIPPHTPVENLDAFYRVVGDITA